MEEVSGPNLPRVLQVYQSSITDDKMQNSSVIHMDLALSCTEVSPTLVSQDKLTCQQTTLTTHLPDSKMQVSQVMHMSLSDVQLPHNALMNSQALSIVPQHSESTQHISNQLMMSCDQPHLHSLHTLPSHMQTPTIHSSEVSPIQISSHMILPSVFKQHMILNGVQQYFGQYEYQKESVLTKIEPELQNSDVVVENSKIGSDNAPVLPEFAKTKKRSKVPNPNKWVCNLRKLKHQRGEAYISRRGQYVPEKKIQNIKDCSSCMYKCSKRIPETDREHIFKAFWSLSSNEKKHFLLNTTERYEVDPRRSKSGEVLHMKKKYTFRYFFLVRSVRFIVCKQFYLGTLSISQKPVYNVHLGKSEVNVPKPDGRGLSGASSHALPIEMIDRVKCHISTFKTIDGKAVKLNSKKRQYLNHSTNVKQMYSMYASECNQDSVPPVKEHMYRKIFKQEFNLHFKRDQKLCCKCQGPIKKSDLTIN